MNDYLITDRVNNQSEWVSAKTVIAALITRENELRNTDGRRPDHPSYGLPLLPSTAKASHYSNGAVVDVSIGNVRCFGRRENVIRKNKKEPRQ